MEIGRRFLDQAYFDTVHGLHVRKSKVRSNISLSPVGSTTSLQQMLF